MKIRVSLAQTFAALFLMIATPAVAGVWQYTFDFETSDPARFGWFAGPGAGFDYDKGLAHKGKGNAWVRNTSGWSAVNIWRTPAASANCTAQAWIRLSPDVTDGYFSVRSGDGNNVGPVVSEVKLVGPGASNPPNGNYNLYSFEFASTGGPMIFYVGNWGNGRDAWEQIDDVVISCST